MGRADGSTNRTYSSLSGKENPRKWGGATLVCVTLFVAFATLSAFQYGTPQQRPRKQVALQVAPHAVRVNIFDHIHTKQDTKPPASVHAQKTSDESRGCMDMSLEMDTSVAILEQCNHTQQQRSPILNVGDPVGCDSTYTFKVKLSLANGAFGGGDGTAKDCTSWCLFNVVDVAPSHFRWTPASQCWSLTPGHACDGASKSEIEYGASKKARFCALDFVQNAEEDTTSTHTRGGINDNHHSEAYPDPTLGKTTGLLWVSSTNAKQWVTRTIAVGGNGEATSVENNVEDLVTERGICDPIQGEECWGYTMETITTVLTFEECCNLCQLHEECEAWTHSGELSTCALKKKCHIDHPRLVQHGRSTSGYRMHRTSTTTTTTTKVISDSESKASAKADKPNTTELSIDTSKTLQTIEGFGGCFNELGWEALSVLSESARKEVLGNLFSLEHGCKLRINRMPIGSSDFATGYYSLNDVVGDYEMEYLSLDRDRKRLIPFIKEAMDFQPDMKVWGSPWTGPEWMKDSYPKLGENEGCGSLSPNVTIQQAYALYLARAAKAYIAEGLNFETLAIQNEPNNGRGTWNPAEQTCKKEYPAMYWTGENISHFIKDYLGPTFERENLLDKVGIMLSTIPLNDYNGYVRPALEDPNVVKYLSGVGLQYAGVGMVPKIRAVNDTIKLWETETPCGTGFRGNCGYGRSWNWGEKQWSYMRSFFEGGVSVYTQWNLILDDNGTSPWGWSQCSPISIHRVTKEVTYHGSFWATKHFSYFIEPGAKLLQMTGLNAECEFTRGGVSRTCGFGCPSCAQPNRRLRFVEVISFLNPNNDVVILAMNNGDARTPLVVKVDGKTVVDMTLDKHSMHTFVYPSTARSL
eukprot:m.75733 g.75733  ORF g.75733 m.75733 type:complete len:865 (-) comp24821_c0_seq1:52-2646(-)